MWDNKKTKNMSELELLIYRSNILGKDPSVTNWGGGNTSAKIWEKNFKGEGVRVLRVKGSGTDLRTITASGFPGVELDDVLELQKRQELSDEAMVEYLAHTLVDLNAKRPSIDTLLHAFINQTHIDHMHPDAIIALCTSKDGPALMRKVFGETAAWISWIRPGFTLAKRCGETTNENPKLKALLLGKHGLFTWGETSKECYENTLQVIAQAQEFLEGALRGKKIFGGQRTTSMEPKVRRQFIRGVTPIIRGSISANRRALLTFDDSPEVLEFVNSKRVRELTSHGAACPDHLVTTKLRPLVLKPLKNNDPGEFEKSYGRQLDAYVNDYKRYYRKFSGSEEGMYDPYPRVILIPGVGLVAAGKDKNTANITNDTYKRTIAVLKRASTVSKYVSMTEEEAYGVEYWPLEKYKFTLQPPERILSRKVALITGAAGGIGKAIAFRFAKEGAHVVIADIDENGGKQVADEIQSQFGKDRAFSYVLDVTNEKQVRSIFEAVIETYGGLDIAVSNAGISSANPIEGTTEEQWNRQYDILAKGYFLVARESFRLMMKQSIGGSIVFVVSKNALASGKNASAYSSAKAAELHLARCLAEEGGAHRIRVNSVCPDAVLQGSKIWNSNWRRERAEAYGIKPEELDEFYRNRNLLKESIYPDDIAEAVLFFASDVSKKTTGGILTVDGGVSSAFVR